MNDALNQTVTLIKSLSLAKKISIVATFLLLLAAFGAMFFWANQVAYEVLFNNLAAVDAGEIIAKLKERNVPYKIEGNGALILVPTEQVHDLRLTLAGEGLPKEGNVGFEIFDKTDFRTTRFVQDLNFKRALQGELARTINRFKEVNSSKVFIVLPKKSLFVEDSQPASASIQLDLRSSLSTEKVSAIVHLAASAVEGLDPTHVTVVDTRGRIIFKGGGSEDTGGFLSNTQLEYKRKIESNIHKNIQSMLEGIVGAGKALVRVNAEIDFNKVTLNEEEYDSAAAAVRSKREMEESSQSGSAGTTSTQSVVNQRRGVIPSDEKGNSRSKRDTTTNYEINKVTRAIFKPAGEIKRLSVAAVIEGTYRMVKQQDGSVTKQYQARSDEDLAQFNEIVKRAMGYNEDREDQVSVSSMPFTPTGVDEEQATAAGAGNEILKILAEYRRTIIITILAVLVFFLILRPLLKSFKAFTKSIEPPAQDQDALPPPDANFEQIPQVTEAGQREKILEISQTNPEKTEQLIKGWIGGE